MPLNSYAQNTMGTQENGFHPSRLSTVT